MAEVCEAAGADVIAVRRGALGYDDRIGGKFLDPGLGFGGGCLPKDIRAFMARADELGVDQALSFLREVDAINHAAPCPHGRPGARGLIGGSFAGARVGVLGASFKPNSDDIRDSPALDVAATIQLAGRPGHGLRPGGFGQRQARLPAVELRAHDAGSGPGRRSRSPPHRVGRVPGCRPGRARQGGGSRSGSWTAATRWTPTTGVPAAGRTGLLGARDRQRHSSMSGSDPPAAHLGDCGAGRQSAPPRLLGGPVPAGARQTDRAGAPQPRNSARRAGVRLAHRHSLRRRRRRRVPPLRRGGRGRRRGAHLGPKAVWFQLGVVDPAAADRVLAAGRTW